MHPLEQTIKKNRIIKYDKIHFRKEVYFFVALKNQRFNKYSQNLKDNILEELNNGVSSGFLAKKYNIPIGTIYTWMNKRRRQGNLDNDIHHKRGRHKKRVTLEDWKERYQLLKKYQAFLKAQREKK